jgi:hypothetical protein
MTRTLSVSVSAQIGQPITAPGYLLEMLFSSPVRLCSRGDVTVLGNDWLAWGFAVTGIGVDATSASQGGALSIDNTELDISTLILEEGIADRSIRIYTFYGDDPQDDDPVLLFDGVGGDVEIDTNVTAIKVSLRQAKDGVQYAPAKYITVEQGFSMLPPPGTVIVFGGQSYVLQPESF